jgi:hypothetical protein
VENSDDEISIVVSVNKTDEEQEEDEAAYERLMTVLVRR